MKNISLKRNSSEIINIDVRYKEYTQQINNHNETSTISKLKLRKSFPFYENDHRVYNVQMNNTCLFVNEVNLINTENKKPCTNNSNVLSDYNNERNKPLIIRLLKTKHHILAQNPNILHWSQQYSSPNIFIVDRVCKRKPIAQFTDLARVDFPINSTGVYVFKITWPTSQRGSHACIGLSTLDIPNSFNGYCSLLGKNFNGWCWDLSRGVVVNNSLETKYGNQINSPNIVDKQKFTSFASQSDVINMIYNGYNKTLSFEVENEYFGIAIDNINNKKTLYPSISSVWGNCEIVVELIGVLNDKVPKLMDICFLYCFEYYGHDSNNNDDKSLNINFLKQIQKFMNI